MTQKEQEALGVVLQAVDIQADQIAEREQEIDRLKADYRRASMSNDVNWKAYKAMKQQRNEALALLREAFDYDRMSPRWSQRVAALLEQETDAPWLKDGWS